MSQCWRMLHPSPFLCHGAPRSFPTIEVAAFQASSCLCCCTGPLEQGWSLWVLLHHWSSAPLSGMDLIGADGPSSGWGEPGLLIPIGKVSGSGSASAGACIRLG